MPSPGPDLQHAPARFGRGQIEDRLEHVRICQEVLRKGLASPQPLRAKEPADGQGIESGRPTRDAGGRARRFAHLRARGIDGRASRSSPRQRPGLPAACRRGADHRPVVGAERRPRHDQRDAGGSGAVGQAVPQHPVRGDAAAQDDASGPDGTSRPKRLGHEHVDHGFLEPKGELRHPPVRKRLRGVTDPLPGLGSDAAPRGSLEPAEAEVERVAQPGPRKRDISAGRPGGGAS